jgi:hypothetical protein
MTEDMTNLLMKANSNTVVDTENEVDITHLHNKNIYINIFKHGNNSYYPSCLDIFRNTLNAKCFDYLYSLDICCNDIKYVNEILEMPNLCILKIKLNTDKDHTTIDLSKLRNNTSIYDLDITGHWQIHILFKIKNFRPNKSLIRCNCLGCELIKPKIVDNRFKYRFDKASITFQNNIIHNDIIINYIKEYL